MRSGAGLAVLRYSQADATFVGLDVEGTATIAYWDRGQLNVSAFFDTVSAELDVSGNDNLSRIPPQRAGLGLDLRWGSFDANIDYVRAFKQTTWPISNWPPTPMTISAPTSAGLASGTAPR